MEIVHVMCQYLKVKTKVTANAPARYIWLIMCVWQIPYKQEAAS